MVNILKRAYSLPGTVMGVLYVSSPHHKTTEEHGHTGKIALR